MPNDNDLVAISKEEYEQLLYYKEAFEGMVKAQIMDCKIKMQMMEMETIVNRAIPPYQQVLPLNDGLKFRVP